MKAMRWTFISFVVLFHVAVVWENLYLKGEVRKSTQAFTEYDRQTQESTKLVVEANAELAKQGELIKVLEQQRDQATIELNRTVAMLEIIVMAVKTNLWRLDGGGSITNISHRL